MPRDEIVAFLTRYAQSFGAPVREGVEARSIASDPGGGLPGRPTAGMMHATSLVLANGAFQRANRPAGAAGLPGDLLQIDVEEYRSPETLPPGGVLVVGSGQSGCQMAEELHEAGREVVLACGRAAWAPRSLGGRDLVWWLLESGFLDAPVASLPSPTARLGANITATGHGGGHDLHLRTLRAQGVTLVGHFLGANDKTARFAPDLVESVAWADDRYRELMDLVRKTAAPTGYPRRRSRIQNRSRRVLQRSCHWPTSELSSSPAASVPPIVSGFLGPKHSMISGFRSSRMARAALSMASTS